MATAELALAIPAVLLVLAMCLSGLSLAIDQVRCVDAARVAARAASRGEASAVVADLGGQSSPSGSVVSVQIQAEDVVVTVRAPRRWSWLPAPEATAIAPLEAGVP